MVGNSESLGLKLLKDEFAIDEIIDRAEADLLYLLDEFLAFQRLARRFLLGTYEFPDLRKSDHCVIHHRSDAIEHLLGDDRRRRSDQEEAGGDSGS
jgi:hypothetical protein